MKIYKAILAIIFTICALFLVASCATKTKIEYRDVDHYITQIQHDTLREQYIDSVYYEIKTKGDTVFATKYKEKIKWKEQIVEKHDTCKVDSIVVQKGEIVKEVVKIPKIYHYALVFSIICFIFAIIKLVKWLHKILV